MPKESAADTSCTDLRRKALEILRMVWSDRSRLCDATNHTLSAARQSRRGSAITKQRLAEHLSVTPRWIELQQRLGLPPIHTPSLNRYRISDVETWLREQYGWSQGP